MAIDPSKIPPGTFEDNLQPTLYGVSFMFLALATIAVVLRFVARRLGHIAWKRDDALVYLSYFFFVILIGESIASGVYGEAGRHLLYVELMNPEAIPASFKFFLAIPMVYLLNVALPKLALLSIYLDVFIQKPTRIACWICVAVIVGNWFANTVVGFKACTPLNYLWDQVEAPGTGYCIDLNAWFQWASLANIITDVVMLVLPIPMVLALQVSTAVRVGVAITFLLGSSGLIASILRFVFFYESDATADSTYSGATLIIWTQMEVAMYIVAACLPTYRPLLRRLGFHVGGTRPTKTTGHMNNGAVKTSSKQAKPYCFKDKFSRLSNSVDEGNEEGGVALAGSYTYRSTVAIGRSDTSDDGIQRTRTNLRMENPLTKERTNGINVQSDFYVQRA